ncbi:MAG: RNA polymerase sigma factor [Anaerolineae bacterium]|nr:RNA polymerase sigma factor [Anaerolineae bacterium]
MPTSLPDDGYEQLMLAQARANPEAFRELYRHYFPRVYAYIAYRVGRVPDAEDLTADTFVRVVEAFHSFEYRGAGSFAAWVFRIAYHQVAAFYRQQRRTQTFIPLDDLPDLHSSAPTPDVLLLEKERFARLRNHIVTLSPRRQEIVTLRFFGGLRNNEIAAVLGLDERTVAAHVSRALEDLQARYADELVDE